MESFERGASTVIEFADAGLSLVNLAPDVFSESGFNPTRHAAPFTAISRYAHGQLFLITTPLKDWLGLSNRLSLLLVGGNDCSSAQYRVMIFPRF